MATPSSTAPQGKKDRREQARETARLEREAQKKRERRNRIFLQGGVGIVVLVIALVIVLIVVNSNKAAGPAAQGPKNMPAGGFTLTSVGGAITPTTASAAKSTDTPTTGKAGAKGVAHIVTYVDWACPACQSFEGAYAKKIAGLVKSGAATLEIHPISILDPNYAGSRYASRAANAAACIANFEPSKFLDTQNAFYANQPKEGSTGLANSQMLDLMKSAGVDSPKITSCVNEETFKKWVTDTTTRTTGNNDLVGAQGFSTPTIFVDGKRWDSKGDFIDFVDTTAGIK